MKVREGTAPRHAVGVKNYRPGKAMTGLRAAMSSAVASRYISGADERALSEPQRISRETWI